MFSGNKELRRNTPGEGPGRGAARGGGVPRATQAICASDVCEVMAVPRHLFANLLDEFPGVRRRLELQVCGCVRVRGGGGGREHLPQLVDLYCNAHVVYGLWRILEG